MNEFTKNLSDFDYWTAPIKGLYRYCISTGCCYEIHIIRLNEDEDILNAQANLYIVGDWKTSTGESFFEREILASYISVADCIETAVEDYKENMDD